VEQTVHIGIVAPCSSGSLADLLEEAAGIDLGCGGYLIATLVRALIERGHHVSVVTLSPEIAGPRMLEGPRLSYYVYPMRTRGRMRDLFKLERQGLKAGIVSAGPDVLHAHWTYEWAMASLETGLPTLVTTHDDGLQQLLYSKDLYRLGRLYMQNRVLKEARFLTAVSPYLAVSMRSRTRAKIDVVPNPIDICGAIHSGSQQDSEEVKIATVLNGWGRRKNAKPAIEAFGILSADLPNAEMYMYGQDFGEEGPAWQWARSKGLAPNIRFRGPLPHECLLRELSTMSILLHPALEESFGMAIVEAMALGVPVVAGSRSGGAPWVLDEGRAGFLTDVEKPKKMAETLLACVGDAAECTRRKRNAYERVRTHFSPDAVAAQYEGIYDKVLAVA
jgi:L-malate glycosyltransferase